MKAQKMNRGIRLAVIGVLLLAAFAAGAQSGITELYSPDLSSLNGSVIGLGGPQADVLNPAISAGAQRTVLDLSCLGLAGLDDPSGWGTVINAGLTLPSAVGVFNGSARFLYSPFADVYPGTLGAFNASFAKDLFPQLWVGAGLGFQAGSDWGLGLDLGFLHLAGDIGFLRDLHWGFSMRGLGKGYTAGARFGYPPPFTPAFGAQFTAVDTPVLNLALASNLSFPTFRDIRFSLGAELAVKDAVFLRASYLFDLDDIRRGTARPLPLSLGAGLLFQTTPRRPAAAAGVADRRWDRSEIRLGLSAAPMQDGVWAFGLGLNMALGTIDRDPPVIRLDTQGERYISPNLDSVQDELNLPVSITDRRYLGGYRFIISDAAGNPVRTIVNKEERPENVSFRNVIDRLAYVKRGIGVPPALRWDGQSDTAAVVADGFYRYQVEAWDDNGNLGRSEAGTVIVDNTPPRIAASAPYLIFSPNGDGSKDTLPVQQEGSPEDRWLGAFQDVSGKEVATVSWLGGEPAPFEWEGRNREGILAEDGVYHYVVTATDRAGNSGSARIDNIIIDTQATPISVSIDLAHFSPNGDGVQDAVVLTPDIPVKTGIERWSLAIRGEDGKTYRTIAGGLEIPPSITFDGNSDQGSRLPEGVYRGALSLLYTNGNNPQASTPGFTLDLTPPKASVVADIEVFSPNDDGNKDAVTLHQEASGEVIWEGTIRDAAGNAVRSFSWISRPDSSLVWNGRAEDGALLADGIYTYVLASTDRAGNRGASDPLAIEVDTRQTPVSLTTNLAYFSPNGDGVQDGLRIIPAIGLSSGIASYELAIVSESGSKSRTFEGRGRAPEEIAWDGLDDGGKRLADGPYTARLEVVYRHGNHPIASTGPFYVDTAYPRVKASPSVLLFSPDDDGRLDTITIEQSSSEEDLWEAEIRNDAGEKVRGAFWKGRVESFEWDGKDENGNKVPDGGYVYLVRAQDRAGNRTEARIEGIRTDTRPTPVFIGALAGHFSPNGDGTRDTVDFSPRVEVKEGIGSWTLSLVGAEGRTARVLRGGAELPERIGWDGRTDSRAAAAEGAYRGVLSVEYLNGSNPKADSPPIVLDLTPPSATARGDLAVFSPNGDGSRDAVTFSQSGSEENAWSAEVKNAGGETVRSISWRGRPETQFIWDGKTDGGTIAPDGMYTYRLSSTDRAGNSGGSAPVSVELSTLATPISVAAEPASFSPNGDGVQDRLRIVPSPAVAYGVESYELHLKRESEAAAVRTYRGSDRLPAELTWDGMDASGRRVPDGAYVAELQVLYRHGNRPVARTGTFTVDTAAPTIELGADATLFSPDGDGRLDSITIRQSSSAEDLWEGRILNEQGQEVTKVLWKGAAGNFTWDGRDEKGNKIPDGAYRYIVQAQDRAGNGIRRELSGLRIDTQPTPVFVTASANAFAPTAGSSRAAIDFTLHVGRKEGIKSWSLAMLSGGGSAKTFTGAAAPADTLRWDGRSDGGTVTEGVYTAALRVEYLKGNLVEARTVPFRLDVSAPLMEVGLSPVPFSPDDDGVDDELTLSPRMADLSPIESWEMEILDPADHHFITFSGKGAPTDRIIWNGLSDHGELVQAAEDYRLVFSARDELGNTGTLSRTIPVDVLVIRDGDKLKVRISSITFAANQADYINVEADKRDKNLKTLKRLAEIFQKYNRYRIGIEGHAVMVYWDDPAKGRKEQEEVLLPLSKARADAVKKALVDLGIDSRRISTEGLGGAQPIVPFGDTDNRWKNRRVEFILIRE